MWKKFSTPVSLLTMLLLSLVAITCSIASEGHLMGDMDIYAAKLKLDQPFNVMILARIGQQTVPASLDVSFSAGVQLLKGETHWQGIVDSTLDKRMDLLFKISEPGTYEISVLEDFIWGKVEPKLVRFPMHRTMFFYASKDTVIWFSSRDERERAIRDSLVFPGILERRTEERNHYQYFLQGAKMKATPFTLSSDLAELTRDIPLYPDSTKYKDLSGSYDSNQVALIRKYTLLYAPPRYDRIEYALSLDFMDRITKEQLQSMVTLVTKQITDLYDVDQKILRMKPSDERTKSLQDRAVLLKKQTVERNAVMEKK